MAQNNLSKHHWLVALAGALAIHLILFTNYRLAETNNGAEAEGSGGIEIGLKKLTLPVIQKKTPQVKKAVKPKSKPIPKPAPVVIQAEIMPAETEEVIQPDVIEGEHAAEEAQGSDKSIAGGGNQELEVVYAGQLLAWLERYKRYPAVARRRQMQATIMLKFTITAEGQLIRFSLMQPSRFNMLNRAVETMVQKASPFPAVPTALRSNKAEYVYQVPIEFILSQ